MDIFIENATTFHVFDFFSVMEFHEDTSTSTVVVEYISEINYPWIIDTDHYEFISTAIPFVDEGVLVELDRGDGCGVVDEYCVQKFQLTFDVNAVCNILGNWTVRHLAVYDDVTAEFDFTARLSLDSACGS